MQVTGTVYAVKNLGLLRIERDFKTKIWQKIIRAVAGQRSSPDLCFATKSVKIYDP